ncbi:hypothetical protein GBAR_LOCUS2835 [Geodia barretti]|uniref:Uncharacterized protein n=1 Tax=Geodia barretti TaxID=519541 RepID=A0AA35R1C0_GEOBA|nr:hypothetical protein GBAR_LOCUS2835 [Geodia barretti]
MGRTRQVSLHHRITGNIYAFFLVPDIPGNPQGHNRPEEQVANNGKGAKHYYEALRKPVGNRIRIPRNRNEDDESRDGIPEGYSRISQEALRAFPTQLVNMPNSQTGNCCSTKGQQYKQELESLPTEERRFITDTRRVEREFDLGKERNGPEAQCTTYDGPCPYVPARDCLPHQPEQSREKRHHK